MRKQALILIFFAMVLGMTLPALAQTGSVKGYVKDDAGKPVVGAVLEFANLENGRKVVLKTDKSGNFFSIGVPIGTYKVTVTQDNKPIWGAPKYPVQGGDNPDLNIDLAKERATAAATNPEAAEQQKKLEAAKKENEKIGGLNVLLKQANDAMAANNYDQAVQIMQQAAAQDQTHDLVFGRLGDAYLGDKEVSGGGGGLQQGHRDRSEQGCLPQQRGAGAGEVEPDGKSADGVRHRREA